MVKKKKIFPKIQKKLKSFLADESGKITKKDALWLAAGAVLLSGVDEVVAGHSNSYSAVTVTCSSTHGSWIVNWHYSSNLTGTPSPSTAHTHASHSSHWSHGQW